MVSRVFEGSTWLWSRLPTLLPITISIATCTTCNMQHATCNMQHLNDWMLACLECLVTCLCAYLCIICNASLSYLRQDGTYSSSVSWLAHVSMHNSESYLQSKYQGCPPTPSQCCMLDVGCCMLHGACWMVHGAWRMAHGAWCSACCMLHIKHQTSTSIEHHMLHAIP